MPCYQYSPVGWAIELQRSDTLPSSARKHPAKTEDATPPPRHTGFARTHLSVDVKVIEDNHTKFISMSLGCLTLMRTKNTNSLYHAEYRVGKMNKKLKETVNPNGVVSKL